MSEHLLLLPGWGFGPASMEPLADCLRQLDAELHVQVVALPQLDSIELNDWLDALETQLPSGTWLVGWSLGGMLAAELAARRGSRCRGLVTVASNACFVANDTWPQAMPADQFGAFQAGYLSEPALTLKRFALLCAQGARDPRSIARLLHSHANPDESLQVALALLGSLDVRAALLAYRGPQQHLLACHDALVPEGAAAALQALLPEAHVQCLNNLGHSLLLDDPGRIAALLAPHFAKENHHD